MTEIPHNPSCRHGNHPSSATGRVFFKSEFLVSCQAGSNRLLMRTRSSLELSRLFVYDIYYIPMSWSTSGFEKKKNPLIYINAQHAAWLEVVLFKHWTKVLSWKHQQPRLTFLSFTLHNHVGKKCLFYQFLMPTEICLLMFRVHIVQNSL